jgi:hypothetical protein
LKIHNRINGTFVAEGLIWEWAVREAQVGTGKRVADNKSLTGRIIPTSIASRWW